MLSLPNCAASYKELKPAGVLICKMGIIRALASEFAVRMKSVNLHLEEHWHVEALNNISYYLTN